MPPDALVSFMPTWHKLESLGRGNHKWENMLPDRPVEHFFKIMIDVGGPSSSWVGSSEADDPGVSEEVVDQ